MDFDTLLIPVESQVRELDGKILFACTAAEKGFKSVIGSRAPIHYYSSATKDSIYVAKSMRRFSERMFNILNQLGHKIVAWDEEALVRLPDEQYYTHRLSPITFNHIEHLFSWGKSNTEVFKNYHGYNNQPVHTFGNPRIDILRPELNTYFRPEVDSITNEFSNYILINTNFGQVNHFIPSVGKKEASRDKNFSDTTTDKFISSRYQHKEQLFEHFKSMIPIMADTFPNINFIVRPHPSENTNNWKDLFSKHKNIIVTNSGNVIPWILGAKLLISNGCTTSIEATIVKTPCLGYYPIRDDLIDDPIPKALNDISLSPDELIEKTNSILTNKSSSTQHASEILEQHIENISGPFACDLIVDTLFSEYSDIKSNEFNIINRTRGKIHNNLRTLVKKYNSHNNKHRNSARYHQYRFPSIDEDYLYTRINRLAEITGRFSNLKVKTLSTDIFEIRH